MDLTDLTPTTERMDLRGFRFDDFDAFHDLNRREDVVRYLPWGVRDEAESRRALGRAMTMRLEQPGDSVAFGGFEKGTGRLVGQFVLILTSTEHRGGEVGYLLHPDFQGRGFATEGAREMLRIAFETCDLRRVVGRLDARNVGSARVLARLGMRHEAHLVENELFKGEWGDEDQYALLRREWDER